METDYTATPHEEAIALIQGKPVVTRKVFNQLLPELRGRAFTVAGVEGANALQRIRDTLAALPQGTNWETTKRDLVAELDPYLGDGAERRAELLLRTHGFQAFQSANWEVAQADEDTTHLQYLATEDDHVRDSHLALNGLILPKDDPFWEDHLPPWEWGCRCRVRPMNPDLVEEARQEDADRAPENRFVMEGAAADQLRNGTLIRDGRRYDVTSPKNGPDGDRAFQWHPDNLALPLEELRRRYDPEVFATFETFAKGTTLPTGQTAWQWLNNAK
jgi:SPP1 gp7 family putative phage head morphogenesis protein